MLDPAELAEIWDVDRLRRALEPLPDGYEIWIRAQEASCAELAEPEREAALRHVKRADKP
jgi:hypothetical protein